MITYKTIPDSKTVYVYLEKKRVGRIEHCADGWRYFPKGASAKFAGDPFATLSECRASLEEPD